MPAINDDTEPGALDNKAQVAADLVLSEADTAAATVRAAAKVVADAASVMQENSSKAAQKEARKRRLDLDVRGLLALLALVGTFSLAFTQLLNGATAEIPAWTAGIVSGVMGFYFGSRANDSMNGDNVGHK